MSAGVPLTQPVNTPSCPPGAAADVYLVINLSCIELPAMEEYVKEVIGATKVLVTWNLELDSLRGDLGLLGYPPKDLHYR